MGVIIKRCLYGAAVKDAKQQIIASIVRFNEILRTGAKTSINIEVKGKTKIVLIAASGASRRKEVIKMDETVFKELMEAKSFEIEINLGRKGPTVPRIMIWYDEEIHRGNSLGIEFIINFSESVSFTFMSLIGRVNEVRGAVFRSISDSVANRVQGLWEDVFRMYVGGSMTKSEEVLNLRKYEVDSVILNVFGNILKIREKY
ncbi:MAG: hypothetical protein GOV01_01930 [Candidatus Altiarchaeota archaeon]|nr:hypothetical protein [Candidatus Altiarchaeota archaeon]